MPVTSKIIVCFTWRTGTQPGANFRCTFIAKVIKLDDPRGLLRVRLAHTVECKMILLVKMKLGTREISASGGEPRGTALYFLPPQGVHFSFYHCCLLLLLFLLMHWWDHRPLSPMPSFSDSPDALSTCWRKRKRDHEDTASLARPYVDSRSCLV